MSKEPQIAGLSADTERLLDALTLTLMRQPNLTREAMGGLSLLRRRRTETANPALTLSKDDTPKGQLTALAALQNGIQATAAADAETLAQRAFGPPDPAALEACLRARLPNGAGGQVLNLKTIDGGYSKQTSFFEWQRADGARENLVLRRDAKLDVHGTTVRDEFPLVVALHRAGYKVAEGVLLVTGDLGIPEPFMIVRRMSGKTIGGPLGAGPDRSSNPAPILAEALAKLHAIPPSSLDVPGFSDRPFDKAALLNYIDFWRDRYFKNRETVSPTLDLAFDFLVAEAEAGLQPGAVVHGDCDFYNLLIEDGRFVALLDWEMAYLGSPAFDLAYVKESVEAFGPYGAFLDEYERHGGVRPSAAALAYYNVFRLLRGGVMCVCGAGLFNRGNPIGLDLLDVNCTLYARFLLQLPDAIAAFHSAKGAKA